MNPGGGGDLLSVLKRRSEMLSLLVDRTREKPELVAELDVSRSTVNRAMRELEAEDLVTRTDDGYVATLPGRLAVESYRSHLAELDAITRTADLLAHLPRDVSVPREMLIDASVHRPEPPTPNAPDERVKTFAERATAIRSLTVCHVGSDCTQTVLERTIDGSLDAEYIVPPNMTDHLFSEYPDAAPRAIEDGLLRVNEHPGIAFGLTVVDLPERTVAAVSAHRDDDARQAGLLVNDADAAVEWARGLFEDFRTDATAIESG